MSVDVVLNAELVCVNCGYSLRGLEEDEACPECGLLVTESLRPELISLHDTNCLKRIRLGFCLWFVSLVGVVISPGWYFVVEAMLNAVAHNTALALSLIHI